MHRFLETNKSNIELVKLLKKGDMSAFDSIYFKYCKRLHGFVLKYLKQEQDAEGVVQEVFIKIWASRSKIDTYSSFDSFIFTIAYNTTISLLRKRLSESKSRQYLQNIQNIELSDSVIEEIEYNELKQKVTDLLKDLSPRQSEIYLLSRDQGLTHKEISKKLNISENTVKNHLSATLKYLRSEIGCSFIVNLFFICLFL